MNPAQDTLKAVLVKLNELLQLSIESSSGTEQKISTSVVQLISMVTTASHAVRTHNQEQVGIQQELAACVTNLEKISRAQGKELRRLSSRSFTSVECNTEPIVCSLCATKDVALKDCNEQLSIALDTVSDLTHKLRVSKTLLQAQQVMLAEKNGFRPEAVRVEHTMSTNVASNAPQGSHGWQDLFPAAAALPPPARQTLHTINTAHNQQLAAPHATAVDQGAAGRGHARPPRPPGAAPPSRYQSEHEHEHDLEEEEQDELDRLEDAEGEHAYDQHNEHDQEPLDESEYDYAQDEEESGEEPRRFLPPAAADRRRWATRAGEYNPGGLEVDVGEEHRDVYEGHYSDGHNGAADLETSGDWDRDVSSPPLGYEAHDSYGSCGSSGSGGSQEREHRGDLSGGSAEATEFHHRDGAGTGEYYQDEDQGDNNGEEEDGDDWEADAGDEVPRAAHKGGSWADAVQGGAEDSFAMVQNYYSLDSAP